MFVTGAIHLLNPRHRAGRAAEREPVRRPLLPRPLSNGVPSLSSDERSCGRGSVLSPPAHRKAARSHVPQGRTRTPLGRLDGSYARWPSRSRPGAALARSAGSGPGRGPALSRRPRPGLPAGRRDGLGLPFHRGARFGCRVRVSAAAGAPSAQARPGRGRRREGGGPAGGMCCCGSHPPHSQTVMVWSSSKGPDHTMDEDQTILWTKP